MGRFLTESAGKAFHDAIEKIEGASSVEIVIAVRSRARHVALPPIVVGMVAMVMTLALALFSETEFSLWEIFALPLAVGLFVGSIVFASGTIERLLVPPAVRRAHVVDAARATFYERGVHATTKRTGVLVFIALRERVVELVPDTAARKAIGDETLIAWGTELATAIPRGGEAVASEIAKLADRFAAKLPDLANDTNELGDDVIDVRHPRGLRKPRGVES